MVAGSTNVDVESYASADCCRANGARFAMAAVALPFDQRFGTMHSRMLSQRLPAQHRWSYVVPCDDSSAGTVKGLAQQRAQLQYTCALGSKGQAVQPSAIGRWLGEGQLQ